MKLVVRTQTYHDDLDAIEAYYIAQNNPQAGADMWLHIDDQLEQLADPLFTCRPGSVVGTFELVAHRNGGNSVSHGLDGWNNFNLL